MNINLQNLNPRGRQPGSTRLGLAFDGSHLEVVEVRRTNGSVEITKSFTTALSLDPLTNAPELVGREIRKVLDEHGIRERWCTVCLPLNWALTLTTKLPDLPKEDIASYLQVEAERGFPYGPEALISKSSHFKVGNDSWATLIGIPLTHVTRMEQVLAAAQLRVATFSIAITALQPADAPQSDGVLALVPGVNNIRMQITVGGGIAVLRTIEGAFEMNGPEAELQTDLVAREVRITLGQLAPELRDAVKMVRVLGKSDAADELAEVLGPRMHAQGLKFEHERTHAQAEFGIKLPINTPVSSALALAMRHLAAGETQLEFLPPKISAWQQFSSKYSSPRLVTAGAVAGAVVAVVLLAFLTQQSFIWYWGYRMGKIDKRVKELRAMQEKSGKYAKWYDTTYRELAILREITSAFPQEGRISLKQIEIRDPNKPGESVTIVCTGTARDRSTLQQVEKNLNKFGVHEQYQRGTQTSTSLDFAFDFKWEPER